MTTHITVKNEGPESLLIRFYNEDRQFSEEQILVPVGDSIEITVWDGHLPVMWPQGNVTKPNTTNRFSSVPPACF